MTALLSEQDPADMDEVYGDAPLYHYSSPSASVMSQTTNQEGEMSVNAQVVPPQVQPEPPSLRTFPTGGNMVSETNYRCISCN